MSCGGSFESSWHSGEDFGARIDCLENFHFNEERFYVYYEFRYEDEYFPEGSVRTRATSGGILHARPIHRSAEETSADESVRPSTTGGIPGSISVTQAVQANLRK